MHTLTNHDRQSGLQVDEDLRFQRTMWRIERFGWGFFVLIILGAVAGLFGDGPLSQATLDTTDPSKPGETGSLQYQRFARSHSESRLTVTLPASSAPGGPSFVSVWLSDEYLSGLDMGRISPEPVYEELASGGVRFYFRLHDGPQNLLFRFRPQRAGTLSGSVRVNDGPAIDFQQTIYP